MVCYTLVVSVTFLFIFFTFFALLMERFVRRTNSIAQLNEEFFRNICKGSPVNDMQRIIGGNPAMNKHPIQGGVEKLFVASCYLEKDKRQPVGSYAQLTTYPPRFQTSSQIFALFYTKDKHRVNFITMSLL